MGVYEILNNLYAKRAELSSSLRSAYDLLVADRSAGMCRLIIKRDITEYFKVSAEIKELETMRDELENLFGGKRDDSNVLRVHRDVWRCKGG